MTREETAKCIKVMQAYANGEIIEEKRFSFDPTEWVESINPSWQWYKFDYRIKPRPKYRPFKDADECWQEMQKHQPFGWIKDKEGVCYIMVTTVDADDMSISGYGDWTLDGIMSCYTFADGTPFGINTEDEQTMKARLAKKLACTPIN